MRESLVALEQNSWQTPLFQYEQRLFCRFRCALKMRMKTKRTLSIRVLESNPNHHLWNNNGSWWGTAEPLLVHYTVGGTSQPRTDYKELSGQVVIEAGRANAPIRVVPLDDTIAEPVETVIISLSPDPSYGLLDHNSATVAISDND